MLVYKFEDLKIMKQERIGSIRPALSTVFLISHFSQILKYPSFWDYLEVKVVFNFEVVFFLEVVFIFYVVSFFDVVFNFGVIFTLPSNFLCFFIHDIQQGQWDISSRHDKGPLDVDEE